MIRATARTDNGELALASRLRAMNVQAHPCGTRSQSLRKDVWSASVAKRTLSLANLHRRDAVVPVVTAGPLPLLEIGHVSGEDCAGAAEVVVLEDGDLPAAGNVDGGDAVIPVGAGATASREIVEVRYVAQYRPVVSSEVRVGVDHDRVTRRRRIVIVACRTHRGEQRDDDDPTLPRPDAVSNHAGECRHISCLRINRKAAQG